MHSLPHPPHIHYHPSHPHPYSPLHPSPFHCYTHSTHLTFTPSGSGDVLRCDVLVDTIHHLEIVTTTRELYEEEAPEAFEVQAYDSKGERLTIQEEKDEKVEKED